MARCQSSCVVIECTNGFQRRDAPHFMGSSPNIVTIIRKGQQDARATLPFYNSCPGMLSLQQQPVKLGLCLAVAALVEGSALGALCWKLSLLPPRRVGIEPGGNASVCARKMLMLPWCPACPSRVGDERFAYSVLTAPGIYNCQTTRPQA